MTRLPNPLLRPSEPADTSRCRLGHRVSEGGSSGNPPRPDEVAGRLRVQAEVLAAVYRSPSDSIRSGEELVEFAMHDLLPAPSHVGRVVADLCPTARVRFIPAVTVQAHSAGDNASREWLEFHAQSWRASRSGPIMLSLERL
jgi:hypothetical protein